MRCKLMRVFVATGKRVRYDAHRNLGRLFFWDIQVAFVVNVLTLVINQW